MAEFECIFEGIANRAKTFELINRGYEPEQRKAGQWFETTGEIYSYFLNILDPLDWEVDAFSMSEFATETLTDGFVKRGNRFFCVAIHRETRSDFTNTVRAFWDQFPAEAA